ncbi:MAG: hypothetical protein JKY65_15865, partial [Planctomycetes bacterium]|nr:hypothetical protein [Planctomycetota bacterium]
MNTDGNKEEPTERHSPGTPGARAGKPRVVPTRSLIAALLLSLAAGWTTSVQAQDPRLRLFKSGGGVAVADSQTGWRELVAVEAVSGPLRLAPGAWAHLSHRGAFLEVHA